ncbi:Beta-lactamase [Candidatus Burkholderia verschuerenii]|uniref:Beta-lactamase n=1 Tax=Candidatus Burkholderia verschuerenii TaxID=242163 RepID=A0A0L0MD26_9BURK|nr:Beta-lactamase [Candidatus Burkholderia verschuerenii]
MTLPIKRLMAAAMLSFTMTATHAADLTRDDIRHAVDQTIRPLMAKNGIPGMAIGVVVAGRAYGFDYGVASKATKRPVTRDTLFELGSVSKTLTATLTSYAQESGALSLSDPVSKFLPTLKGSKFGDDVSLLELGTHTPGGLPLQVPDEVHDNDELMTWFKAWQPRYAPGRYRTYANPGIGTLGLITAKSMKQDFDALMQQRVFPAFGMKNSFMHVPASREKNYAQGYTTDDKPIRMKPGVLASEAYGVRATAADMTRFMQANMRDADHVADAWQRAAIATHTGYFKAGPLTQDLIWEQYPYPVDLNALQEGNAPKMIVEGVPRDAHRTAASAARRRVDQQDRFDQRLRYVHRVRAREACRHRDDGESQLSE